MGDDEVVGVTPARGNETLSADKSTERAVASTSVSCDPCSDPGRDLVIILLSLQGFIRSGGVQLVSKDTIS